MSLVVKLFGSQAPLLALGNHWLSFARSMGQSWCVIKATLILKNTTCFRFYCCVTCFQILSSRKEDALKKVADECDKIAGKSVAKVLAFDLEDDQSLNKCKTIESLWGPVDILVNNAGVSTRSPAECTEISVDAKVMKVNYLAPVAITKSVLTSMLSRKSGHIVVISSVQGRLPIPFRSS
jgi:dehydrogenase/reductase SDR family member 7B